MQVTACNLPFIYYILLLVPSLNSADGVADEKKQKRTAVIVSTNN
jgi:hypothetical protein